ncbi:MAG: ABC transporter substrate-binding protein [Chloroflexi bacterium]|nr:ABC transporter substrate-binding protein [Chloroflexota bacterium]
MMRVISLVPSVTQSIVDLGLGNTLIGVTEFCQLYPELEQQVDKIGTPKKVAVEQVFRLRPDFVFCNPEENSQKDVEEMQELGIPVVLQFPKTIDQALSDLWEIARLLKSQSAAARVDMLERSWEWFRDSQASEPKRRVFCPIWQSIDDLAQPWWMAFNGDTYPGDVIRQFGGENIFETRQRLYPLEADLGLLKAEDPGSRDVRYPRVTQDEIIEAQPEIILLPSEPFAYSEGHVSLFLKLFGDTPAGKYQRVRLVDGRLLTWHGTFLAHTLVELPDVLICE